MEQIAVGLVGEATVQVTEELCAPQMGSGRLLVYATPAMIALIEQAATAAVDKLLSSDQASVGTAIEMRHLAATAPGHAVRARATITEIEGRQVRFQVEAWDDKQQIGVGTHTRFIVDVARFMQRLESK